VRYALGMPCVASNGAAHHPQTASRSLDWKLGFNAQAWAPDLEHRHAADSQCRGGAHQAFQWCQQGGCIGACACAGHMLRCRGALGGDAARCSRDSVFLEDCKLRQVLDGVVVLPSELGPDPGVHMACSAPRSATSTRRVATRPDILFGTGSSMNSSLSMYCLDRAGSDRSTA
jgi:hypothetical protein